MEIIDDTDSIPNAITEPENLEHEKFQREQWKIDSRIRLMYCAMELCKIPFYSTDVIKIYKEMCETIEI